MHPDVMAARLRDVVITPDLPITQALERLQRAGTGMLLLADGNRKLVGVLTDGDIRRHILAGEPLDRPCGTVASRTPLVASPSATPAETLRLMDEGREYVINHLPVVGTEGEILGLWLRSDLVAASGPSLAAVIMAGGFGTRLRPLTESVPKPMLPLGDRPLLERTVNRLREAGIRDVRVTTHYLGESITDHFGDGHAFGVEMTYLRENQPLGTAGALSRLKDSLTPLLVMNGDILTTVDFQAMLAFHREHRADATIGVRKYDIEVPYGVVQCTGVRVRALQEKPVQRSLVNAGIYLLEPSVLACIPEEERFDMTDLVQRLLDDGRMVVSFPIVEYWLDIGRSGDYERAQDDVREARV
jgi:dTDP-glucose pyrophosphorylase/CBS domain-containing protein